MLFAIIHSPYLYAFLTIPRIYLARKIKSSYYLSRKIVGGVK